jgi:hypothetical protein
MSSQNIEPIRKEEFSDSKGISRPILVFEDNANSNSIKGTIAFLLGGYLDDKKQADTVIVGSKGWNNSTLRPVNQYECNVIQQLIKSRWRVLIFESMQFAKPDDTIANELWVEDYVEWIEKKFSQETKKKIFMLGFSSGAYIVALHLRHIAEGGGKGSVAGYGIFGFSVTLDKKTKKTDFSPEHFKTPTLFLSGSSKEDSAYQEPKVDGYSKTKKIYNDYAVRSGVQHGWEALNTGHAIFQLPSTQNREKQAITNIIDNWFGANGFPGKLVADGISIENIKNPDSVSPQI